MSGRRQIVWGAVVASLVLAVSSLLAEGGLRRYWRLERDIGTFEARIAELTEENARLRREVQGLRDDPETIEQAVREELGFVRAGEIVVTLEGAK